MGGGMVLRWEQPHDVQKPTVSSAQEEMSVGHHPALGAGVCRSTGSCPQGDFDGVLCSEMGALGLVKSTSEEGIGAYRNFWAGFVFSSSRSLQTGARAHLLSAASAVPREDDGQGATALRKRLCCRAQPLNSATFREPHTCFKGLLFALESSSEMPRLQNLNTSVR